VAGACWPWPRSVRGLLWLLLLLVLIPVLGVQAVFYQARFSARRADELAANREMARAVATAFDNYLQDVLRQQWAMGCALAAGLPPSQQAAYLRRCVQGAPALRSYLWARPSGTVIAASDQQAAGRRLDTGPWRRALARGRTWGVGNLFLSPAGQPSFYIGRAIPDRQGRLEGLLVAEVDAGRLEAALAIRRSRQGVVAVLDRRGRLVYRYPTFRGPWAQRDLATSQPGVAQALAGQEVTATWYWPPQAGSHMGALVPVRLAGWVAGASRPEAAVLAQMRQDLWRESGLFLLVALLAFLVAGVIGNSLSTPLRRLGEHALALGRGELDRQAETPAIAELARLGQAFNHMAAERRQAEQEREQLLRAVERERQRAEALAGSLQAERDRLHAIMENTRTHLAYLDPDFNFVLVNSTYVQGCGYGREQLLGRNHFEFFPHAENEAIFEQVRDTGQPVEFQARPFEFPGQPWRGVTYWDWTLAPVKDAAGRLQGLVLSVTDVTEQQRAQQERERLLAQMEAQRTLFQTVVDHAPAGICVLDGQALRVKWCNPAYRRFLDPPYCDRDLAGVPLSQFLPGEQVRALFRQVAATRQAHLDHEYRYPGFSRGPTYWDWSLIPLPAPPGQVPDLMVLATDVSPQVAARKRVEELAAQTEASLAQLEAVLTSMTEGLVISDLQGNVLSMNPAALRLYGYDTPEQAQRPLRELAQLFQLRSPQGRRLPLKQWPLPRVLRGETFSNLEVQVHRLDTGATWSGSYGGTPVRDKDGQVILGVLTLRDITARTRAEKELERERAYLSSAIELLPFPIFFVSPQGEITRANQACHQLLPGGLESWQQVKLLHTFPLKPASEREKPLLRALRGTATPAAEWIALLPDGRRIPILLHSAPIKVEGKTVAAAVAIQDISPLKVADRAKDDFLAVLSHELLTPLTSILGWAQLARRRSDRATLCQSLEVVERNAARQKRLVDDLLDVSRLIHGKVELQLRPVDLRQLAAQAVEALQHQAQERGVQVSLAPGPELPVCADPERMLQVISNLLVNALKFTEPGGTVTVTGWRQDDCALLAVADSGRGLAPEALAHIFDPFRQVERSEAAGGLGLGLALVKGLMALHGGQVTADSPGPGQGAAFTLELPLGPPA